MTNFKIKLSIIVTNTNKIDITLIIIINTQIKSSTHKDFNKPISITTYLIYGVLK